MKYIGDILYNLPVHFFPLWKMSELLHDKSNKMTCLPSEYSDKPRHPTNLIPVITVRMKKPWVLVATHWVHSEDSGQTEWMPSLIWVFAGCTDQFACFVMLRLKWSSCILQFSAFQIQINYVLLYLIMPFWNIWHVKIIYSGQYGLGWQWPMLHNTLTAAEWANLWEVCISTEGLQNTVLLND